MLNTRSLRPGDVERIQELYAQTHWLGNEEALAKLPGRLMYALEREDTHLLTARSDQGLIISMLACSFFYRVGITKVEIEDVVTDSEYRRQGYMSALIDFTLEWLREQEIGEIYLLSSDKAMIAHSLYQSKGFSRYDTNCFVLET